MGGWVGLLVGWELPAGVAAVKMIDSPRGGVVVVVEGWGVKYTFTGGREKKLGETKQQSAGVIHAWDSVITLV